MCNTENDAANETNELSLKHCRCKSGNELGYTRNARAADCGRHAVGTWEVAEQLRRNRKTFEQEERVVGSIGWYDVLQSGLGIECAELIV